MNWKTDLKLSDLEAKTALEVTCRRCGLTRYEPQERLIKVEALAFAYLDEVEKHLTCASQFCRGPVRIALVHDGKNEGFVGGVA